MMGLAPWLRPKSDSTPQNAVTVAGSTPKRACAVASACAPALHHGAPVRDALLIDEPGEIIPDRRLEFRLRLGQRENAVVGLQPMRRLVEGRRIDAGGEDGALEASETFLEGCGPRRAANEAHGGERCEDRARQVPVSMPREK